MAHRRLYGRSGPAPPSRPAPSGCCRRARAARAWRSSRPSWRSGRGNTRTSSRTSCMGGWWPDSCSLLLGVLHGMNLSLVITRRNGQRNRQTGARWSNTTSRSYACTAQPHEAFAKDKLSGDPPSRTEGHSLFSTKKRVDAFINKSSVDVRVCATSGRPAAPRARAPPSRRADNWSHSPFGLRCRPRGRPPAHRYTSYDRIEATNHLTFASNNNHLIWSSWAGAR